MIHRTVRGLGALAIIVAAAELTACASTTIDPSVTTAEVVETTTTLPTGTAEELLPRLVVETGKLSGAIGADENKGEQMQTINNLWDAARPEVAANDGILVLTFDATIALCQTGARLNHPADADKCFRNLTQLVDSYLSKYP